MDTTGQELHPNWRALATIHLPLKRFIREGVEAAEKGIATQLGKKYIINGVSGVEAKEFYEKITKDEQYKIQTNTSLDKFKDMNRRKSKRYECAKEQFQKDKYFRFAIANNVEELQKLDYNESDVGSRDLFGWTALMMAACEGAEAAVKFLLELGVDKETRDTSGNTALNLAKKKGHLNIVKLFEEETASLEEETKESLIQAPINPYFCATCKRSFTETKLREHYTSTVHQFNEKPTLPANKLQKFNIPPKNRGLQLMVKQGWDKESGLGPEQAGRLYPVKTVIRKQRTGLGIEQPPARITHFEAFDLRATQRRNCNYYKAKPRTRNDMRREKQREWKREKRLRNELKLKMPKSDSEKTIEIIRSTEEVADKILVNKQELVELDKRRQQTREAIREIEKTCANEKKVWITIGSMLVKLEREKALKLLKNDQTEIEREINTIKSDQKVLLNKHRDLEHFSPYSGTNIKPLDRKEFATLKANLPLL